MTPLEMIYQIMMDQGVTAGLLIILIIQQYNMSKSLLKKICKLDEFIMACLKSELDEHTTQDYEPNSKDRFKSGPR